MGGLLFQWIREASWKRGECLQTPKQKRDRENFMRNHSRPSYKRRSKTSLPCNWQNAAIMVCLTRIKASAWNPDIPTHASVYPLCVAVEVLESKRYWHVVRKASNPPGSLRDLRCGSNILVFHAVTLGFAERIFPMEEENRDCLCPCSRDRLCNMLARPHRG